MSTVSVIIPVYNVREWLDRCVASVAQQTHSDLEIILVDDGSTDGSGALCDEWGLRDERIRVLHLPNGGVSRARNAALDIARGQYVTFVDSDDWIHPELMLTLLDDSGDAPASIAVANFLQTDGTDVLVANRPEPAERLSRVQALGKLLGADHTLLTVAWGKLFSRDIFKELRFPEGRLHEDEFTAHQFLLAAEHVTLRADPLYFYFVRESGIMGSPLTASRGMDMIDADMLRADDLVRHGFAELAAVAWRQLVRRIIKVLCWAVRDQQSDFQSELTSLLRDLRRDSRWTSLPPDLRLLARIASVSLKSACRLLNFRASLSSHVSAVGRLHPLGKLRSY